jgi:N-acetyl-gamma-glutamyl-phosphate reductase
MTSPLLFIDGDQGTTGLQIRERLGRRSDLQFLSLSDADRKNPVRRAEALNACDIAILCLPDPAAREAVAFITNPAVRVIDASSAHRTTPGWIYGFPEMAQGQAQRIATAQRVSNPGCYPTGVIGLLRPLIDARLLPPDYPVSVTAVSGYSGGGRAAVEAYEGTRRDASTLPFKVYGLSLAHKHPPEMQHYTGLAARPIFVPAYGAFRQGIALTVPIALRQLAAGVDAARLRDQLAQHYANARHVKVLSAAQTQALDYLDPQALNGSNDMWLGVLGDAASEQAVLFAVFDNLGKGAAGAAVQNLELMLAIDQGAAQNA